MTNRTNQWHWPQFAAAIALLAIRISFTSLWLTGLIDFSPRWAARSSVIDFLLLCWVAYGWWVSRHWLFRWLFWPAVALCLAGLAWSFQAHSLAIAIFGTACMTLCFAAGLGLIRLALSPGFPVLAIARTFIDEAMRLKSALGFILALALLVPILPALIDQNTRLAYRIQMYLTWGLSGTTVMLSLLTLFLACGTICNDITRRQILLTLTKPITRIEYLLGKWLGIVLLNLLLISVCGAGVYAFTRALQHQTAQNQLDQSEVNNQILVARLAIPASPPSSMSLPNLYDQQLQQLAAQDPQQFTDPDDNTRRAIEQSILASWHSLQPLQSQTYLFAGLDAAKPYCDSVQLRIKAQALKPPPDSWLRLALHINDRPFGDIKLADGIPHTIEVPLSQADASGNIELRITNVNSANPRATYPSKITFAPGDGLQILYPVDSFGSNLIRALLMLWVRLAYLAMLGLAAGTFLGFPVACLFSLLVFITASTSGFLSESLQYYAAFTTPDDSWTGWLSGAWLRFSSKLSAAEVWEAIKVPIRLVGDSFVAVTPSFSRYNPVPQVSQGYLVETQSLLQALWNIGFLWTAACATVAWLFFRRRELSLTTQ